MPHMNKQAIAMMRETVIKSAQTIRDNLVASKLMDHPEIDNAWAELETYMAMSLRVIAKTNPSKVASEYRTVEISARMAGNPVLD